MNARGVYQNPNRGRQLLRFDGMQYGTITPTDMDGIIEYHDTLWVLYEAKIAGKDVPQGQRILLERFIRNTKKAGKYGIAVIAEHTIQDTGMDIYFGDCKVRELITTDNQTWRPPKFDVSVKQITDLYINYYKRLGVVT